MMLKGLALLSILGIVSAATNKVVCYHGIWSTYRLNNGKFTVEDIDPTLCTHLIYSFVGLGDDSRIKHLEPNLDVNQGNLKKFNALKLKNPNLKTLVAIGGWNEGSVNYSKMAASSSLRAVFIKSVVEFVKTWGFDGFDLDWEYPGQRGGAYNDKSNYVTLIKEMRKEFDKNGLILTAAVAAASGSVDISYDVPALSKYLDIINVMAYDLRGSWDGVTGHHSGLYPSAVDTTTNQKLLTVDAAIRGWIQRGADPQKIALGLPVYGKTFTLSSASNAKLGAPVKGAGNSGKYTGEAGMLGYNEIVELQKEGGWKVVWDDTQKNTHMYKGDQWVAFDSPKAISNKVEYAKSLNLGGVMIWSIETDDFRGVSGTKYPILKAIHQTLGGSSNEIVEPVPQPVEEVTQKPSSTKAPAPPSRDLTTTLCTKAGYVRDPDDCSIFYYCLAYNGGFVPLEQRCNAGLVFDEEKLWCDYPEVVKC
ncbi:chitinase 4 precursor [Tribolium castaneum]|nr:chitinase 4 precursor [Tribolium castaneum]ABL73927.1 chitinase 4 [Tribolium castaneum]|eukprot:NP_001073567.1 chitinase 4 precursor [Tribolium castaneum]